MIRISWSSLRTHEECKQKGHLTRTKKLASLANKRNFLPGTVTDRVVRDWLNNDPSNHPGAMPDMVHDWIHKAVEEVTEKEGVVRWREDIEDKARVEAECIEAVTKIEPLLQRYVLPFEYQPDYHFQAPLGMTNPRTGQRERVVLNGYMDILIRDDLQRWGVWDVKHTRDESYWRKTVGQLGFYDLALFLQSGQPTAITGLFQPLCEEPMKPYFPSEESRTQLLQRIHAMARDIMLEDHTPKADSENCNWCDARHACSKFEPVIDDRGKKRLPLF